MSEFITTRILKESTWDMKIDDFELIEDPDGVKAATGRDELYIMTADLEQGEKKEVQGPGGTKAIIHTPQKYNPNYRTALPKVGTVYKAIGKDCRFTPGTQLICNHFTFVDQFRRSTHFMEQDGVRYYRVAHIDVLAGIVDGELVPQDNVILCEPIISKLVNTKLEVADEYVDIRRDVAKIVKIGDNYKNVLTEGHYLFLDEGGDYIFEHDGKQYIAVEMHLEGGIMYGPEYDTYWPQELWRHKDSHGVETDPIHGHKIK